MAGATRLTKSLSLDRTLLKEVERSRGSASTSERVNALLRIGLEIERKKSLHREAADFFAEERSDSALHDAFLKAGIGTFTRDER